MKKVWDEFCSGANYYLHNFTKGSRHTTRGVHSERDGNGGRKESMARNLEKQDERCAICGCLLNRNGKYGEQSLLGRAHASKHHYVAERFFGRSGNRKATLRARLFEKCPWGLEGECDVFCYECHEILLHNPVFTRENILDF